ncbi:MAG: SDR family oxidoreductase [Candidatus Rokubacteria bacterium]|nr:SDR family oxidoreductase [Candidatus Rokubacteria bacterium]
MGFKGQTIIVTGAGYGIGRAIALRFGHEGANVVLAARSRDKLEAAAAELTALGTNPLVVVTDVSSEPDAAAMVRAAVARYGGIDVLVNNAGIAGPTKLARDIAPGEWEETLAINLSGAFYCAKHASAVMIERGEGSIVNIASVAGRIGYPLRTPYAASKWGMIGLSHSLAAELGPHGIRVNVVVPGPIHGERIDQVIAARAKAEGKSFDEARQWFVKDIPLRRMPTGDEVAEAVLFLASGAASAITGQAINVCGGFRMQ